MVQQVMAAARSRAHGACAVLMAVFTLGIHRVLHRVLVVQKGPGRAPEYLNWRMISLNWPIGRHV